MDAESDIFATGPEELESLRHLQEQKVAAMADRTDTVVDILQRLLEDAALRSHLATAARVQSSRLTLEAMHKGIAELICRSASAKDYGLDAVALSEMLPARLPGKYRIDIKSVQRILNGS